MACQENDKAFQYVPEEIIDKELSYNCICLKNEKNLGLIPDTIDGYVQLCLQCYLKNDEALNYITNEDVKKEVLKEVIELARKEYFRKINHETSNIDDNSDHDLQHQPKRSNS